MKVWDLDREDSSSRGRVDSFPTARLAVRVASASGNDDAQSHGATSHGGEAPGTEAHGTSAEARRGASSVPPGPTAAGGPGGARSHEGSTAGEGSRLESIVSETLRRLLEAGIGRLAEQPEQLKQRLSEMKVPREAWSAILGQLDDKKSGLYRLLAKEIRDFLENTNFAADLAKALTTLSFEIKTEVRFVPTDTGAKPKVSSAVRVKQHDET